MLSCPLVVQSFNKFLKFGILSRNNLLHTSQVYLAEKKSSKSKKKKSKVAVVLVGCGVQDGTDICEAISVAIHLSENNAIPKFYAPNLDICVLMNHLTQEADTKSSPRNSMVEAARIARSDIKPLCHLDPKDYGALIVPGGLGAARLLSNFESQGCNCTVHPELEYIIHEFEKKQKPIGSICIASAIMGKVLVGSQVTLGKECPLRQWPYAKAIEKVRQMGANVVEVDVTGVSHCKKYNLFSTPAWLCATATYADVHEGIGNMIKNVVKGIK